MKSTLDRKTEEFQRTELESLLSQLTSDQRAAFGTIYPQGVPAHRLRAAYDLCERTIKLNQQKTAQAAGE